MKYLLCAVALVYLCAPLQAGDSDRIVLENWQMARMRIGGIVEFQTSVKNLSSDAIERVVVSSEYLDDKGKVLGRTSEQAVANTGHPDRGKVQGVIAQLPGGRSAPVTVRAAEVPAFTRYVVTIRYQRNGEACEEKFEGGQIGGEAPQRVLSTLLADRLEVRMLDPDLAYAITGKSRQKEAGLTFRLKNVSALEARGLKVTLELQKGGREVLKKILPLTPGVLKGGQELNYNVRVGRIPVYDSYKTSLSYDEPKTEEIAAAAAPAAGEVEVKGLKVEPGQNGRITGIVSNGLKQKIAKILVTVETSRNGTAVQKIPVDDLSTRAIDPGARADFDVKGMKIEPHDAAQATVEYQILPN